MMFSLILFDRYSTLINIRFFIRHYCRVNIVEPSLVKWEGHELKHLESMHTLWSSSSASRKCRCPRHKESQTPFYPLQACLPKERAFAHEIELSKDISNPKTIFQAQTWINNLYSSHCINKIETTNQDVIPYPCSLKPWRTKTCNLPLGKLLSGDSNQKRELHSNPMTTTHPHINWMTKRRGMHSLPWSSPRAKYNAFEQVGLMQNQDVSPLQLEIRVVCNLGHFQPKAPILISSMPKSAISSFPT